MDAEHTSERQVVGEIYRRRAEEAEALAAASSMTMDEIDEAGLPPAVADAKRAVREATGKRKPSVQEVEAVMGGIPEDQRVAASEALADEKEST